MKKSLFVIILAVFFTAVVSVFGQSVNTGRTQPEPLDVNMVPVIEKIFVSMNSVNYELKLHDGILRFTTDAQGNLVSIYAVQSDYVTMNYERHSQTASGWNKNKQDKEEEQDPAAWATYFAKKVAPVRVTISPTYGGVEIDKSAGLNARWTLVGEGADPDGNRHFVIQKIETQFIRLIPQGEFIVPPVKGRVFALGILDGRYCAIENVTRGDGLLSFTAITVKTF
jgi:hypothetical protein